ncbi:hypothetical protein MTR67_019029 [Solanum verrucosum]|uniref:Peptidase S9 prolyl oligopeptidase catalytic domain-containing protein n=1 Tax=Solanum verrucosum TaxID=315347 RepID=A0AAF0TN62_SOLVR|nr:hypothetical protein MTR67_019029 [Solanum verrucosum]
MGFSGIATLTRHYAFCYSVSVSSFSSSLIHITPSTKLLTRKLSLPIRMSSTNPNVKKHISPYGSWKSPITADIVSGSTKRLGGFSVDSLGHLFWLESRPTESGRAVIVKEPGKPGEDPIDVTPKDFAVRTLAQEYGGDSAPLPLTPDYGGRSVCYADGVFDSRFNRYVTVREDQRESGINAITTIVSIDLSSNSDQEPRLLVGGNDFYASPRIDPKGDRMAWIEWGHPNMPWDRSELWVGYISENGDVQNRICVAGGDPSLVESPTEPLWSSQANTGLAVDFLYNLEMLFCLFSFLVNGETRSCGCFASERGLRQGDPLSPFLFILAMEGFDSMMRITLQNRWVKGFEIEDSRATMEAWNRPATTRGKISLSKSLDKGLLSGELYFVTDRKSGFWNIYKWVESSNEVLPVYSLDAEFTRPLWVFGMKSYDFLKNHDQDTLIACSYRENGKSYLGVLDVNLGKISVLDIPFTDINNITSGVHSLYVEGASSVHPSSIAKVTLDDQRTKVIDFKIMWSSSSVSEMYNSYYSRPELIKFPTDVPGQCAYAYFYPPTNTDFQASHGETPPLLLRSHVYDDPGGPTAEARGCLNLSIQYWTSRGWAYVDVNYGGSTGYGREYRERLLGSWGIVDVNDCCNCAKFLVDSGRVDGERLCITGSSAGGYTTLAALAFKDVFKAGASLIGGHSDMVPVVGGRWQVVSPDQSRKIYQALKEKGLPVALVEYEGEQHGFRKAENIKFTLEQQMVFFARLVGHFEVADEVTPVKIDNFD